MGGILSWIRGNGNGLSERKKAMLSVKENIEGSKKELNALKASHHWIVWTILKLLLSVEIGLIGYNWMVYDKNMEKMRFGLNVVLPLIGWPFICWVAKRVVDWYYRLRIRRGESRLEGYYGEQKKILKEIESDPEFLVCFVCFVLVGVCLFIHTD
jgi:hypothetical protein